VLTFELEQAQLMKHKFSFLFWIGSLFSSVVFVSYSLCLHLQPFWLFVVASETYSLLMHSPVVCWDKKNSSSLQRLFFIFWRLLFLFTKKVRCKKMKDRCCFDELFFWLNILQK
jgi:hypothetical protein